MVKNIPAMQEMQVRSLGQEDSPGEGNENPLQRSGPKNPMDRKASVLQFVGSGKCCI